MALCSCPITSDYTREHRTGEIIDLPKFSQALLSSVNKTQLCPLLDCYRDLVRHPQCL